MRTPTVAADERVRELVRLELTSFDDAVRDALAADQPGANAPSFWAHRRARAACRLLIQR